MKVVFTTVLSSKPLSLCINDNSFTSKPLSEAMFYSFVLLPQRSRTDVFAYK